MGILKKLESAIGIKTRRRRKSTRKGRRGARAGKSTRRRRLPGRTKTGRFKKR